MTYVVIRGAPSTSVLLSTTGIVSIVAVSPLMTLVVGAGAAPPTDVTAPTMVTSSPTSIAELQDVIANLVVSEAVTVTSITGTDAAFVKVVETGPSTTLTIKRQDNAVLNYESKASYAYTLNVQDGAGNTAALAMISNVNNVDEQPDTATLLAKADAVAGSSNQITYTVAGLATGVSVAFQIAGTGATFKKGAGTLGTTPITATNGDVITIDVVADAVAGATRTATLTGGEPSLTIGTFNVATVGAIGAPVLTLTSADGVDPPTFSMTVPTNAGESTWVWEEVDTNNPPNPASANYRAEKRVLLDIGSSGLQLADAVTFVPGDFTSHAGLPAASYYARRWFEQNLGDTTISSPKSNVVPFSIVNLGITFGWNQQDKSTWGAAGTQVISGTNDATWTVLGTKPGGGTGAAGADSPVRGSASFTSGLIYFRLLRSGNASNIRAGVATGSYGTNGSIASAGDAYANMNQRSYIAGSGAIYIADAYAGDLPGTNNPGLPNNHYVDVAIDCDNHKIWFGGPLGYDGNPVAKTGGRSLPAAAIKAFADIFINNAPESGVVTIDTLANANANKPSGFTAAGV